VIEPDTAFVALKLLFALSPLLGIGAVELVLHLRERRRRSVASPPAEATPRATATPGR
jgi:hypothetical protein